MREVRCCEAAHFHFTHTLLRRLSPFYRGTYFYIAELEGKGRGELAGTFVFQCLRAYRNRIGRSRQKQVPTRPCNGKAVSNRRITTFKTREKNKGAGLG